jgi:hypothetical protein
VHCGPREEVSGGGRAFTQNRMKLTSANQREALCVKGWGSGPWVVVGPCIAATELVLGSV